MRSGCRPCKIPQGIPQRLRESKSMPFKASWDIYLSNPHPIPHDYPCRSSVRFIAKMTKSLTRPGCQRNEQFALLQSWSTSHPCLVKNQVPECPPSIRRLRWLPWHSMLQRTQDEKKMFILCPIWTTNNSQQIFKPCFTTVTNPKQKNIPRGDNS